MLFFIKQYTVVCYLSTHAHKAAAFVKSAGACAFVLKRFVTGTAPKCFIIMPSTTKKIFSGDALALLGSVAPKKKSRFINTSAGY